LPLRILAVGRIDEELREALASATSPGSWIEIDPEDDLVAAVSEARPHLLVVGGGVIADLAWAIDPGPDDAIVPTLASTGSEATCDLDWPEDATGRATVLRAALRLARLRRAVVEGTGAFLDTLERELLRAIRYRHPMALLLVRADADPGPGESGSRIVPRFLDALADAVRPTTRDVDFVLRPSAGELAVVLPETDSNGAVAAGERILAQARRLLVKAAVGPGERAPLPFRSTASIGFAEAPGRGAETAEELLALARRAAAEAVAAGGDRMRRVKPT